MEIRPAIKERLRKPAYVLGGLVLLLWVLEILDVLLFDQALNRFGVQPRTLTGLQGIMFMPLLHSGLGHLMANTLPLVVLGGIVLLRRRSDFVLVTVVTMLVTGVGLWLVGRTNAVYIGASGLVFGYFGFLLVRAYFDRSWRSLVIAVMVFLLYGGLLWALILPGNSQPGVSWGAHFLGFIGGVTAAWLIVRRDRVGAPASTPEAINLDDQIRIL